MGKVIDYKDKLFKLVGIEKQGKLTKKQVKQIQKLRQWYLNNQGVEVI